LATDFRHASSVLCTLWVTDRGVFQVLRLPSNRIRLNSPLVGSAALSYTLLFKQGLLPLTKLLVVGCGNVLTEPRSIEYNKVYQLRLRYPEFRT
jgi:hypothetical protein